MSVSITSNNVEIEKTLEKFIEEGFPDKLAEALQQACLKVEGKAKELCPVDDGQLRQSINSKVDKENLKGVIGSNVEYAPYVEVGTGIYAKDGNGRKTPWMYENAEGELIQTVGSHPQPYLEPAATDSLKEIEECFRGII